MTDTSISMTKIEKNYEAAINLVLCLNDFGDQMPSI